MHKTYSRSQKIQAAEYAGHHGARAAGLHFGIHDKNVQRWLKEEIHKVQLKRSQAKRISLVREERVSTLQPLKNWWHGSWT